VFVHIALTNTVYDGNFTAVKLFLWNLSFSSRIFALFSLYPFVCLVLPIIRFFLYPVQRRFPVDQHIPWHPKENLWLKGLSDDLNTTTAGTILEESRRREHEAELGAYLYALLRANAETIEEVYRMADKKLTLDEVLEKIGLTAEWEKRGEARGEAKGEARGEKNGWEKAIALMKQGYTPDQLEQMNP
jgi:hypothetical protein